MPFQPDQFSRKGLTSFHEIINDISEMGITDTPKIIGYIPNLVEMRSCLLYTSDAADERSSVDLGGRRIIKKKRK